MNEKLLQQSKIIIDKYVKENTISNDVIVQDYKQFLRIPFGLIEQKSFYKKFNNPLALYFHFRRHIIRGGSSPLYTKLTKKYFDNGWLVAARAYSEIVKTTDWSISTIKNFIKDLEKDGIIRVDKVRSGRGRPQNVFLLGRKDGGMERFFIDEVMNE